MATSPAPSSKSDREELRNRIGSVHDTINKLQIHYILVNLYRHSDISGEDVRLIQENLKPSVRQDDHSLDLDGPTNVGEDMMLEIALTDWQLAKDILQEKIDDLLLEDKEDNRND
ncbi:MAG: hypothetical protein OXF25_01055 [Cyanobacteria bacterium MAG CAR3_bin_5]|nr:hypothetical protein [Cyanobacteria bacterium MAG CAR3_bin_5]